MPFNFLKNLVSNFTGKPVDWDELEETLIRADLGVPMALQILETLRARGTDITTNDVAEVTRSEISQVLSLGAPPLRPLPAKPKAIMMVGVNGTGKTTSSAKLAHALKADRHSVLLVAADTFRAAAIEQIVLWGDRIDVEVIKGQYQGDSAALCYDAYASADRRSVEFLICDTAGRLHTKSNLMQELQKVIRTLGKHDPDAPHEKLLVVDATTGSNALEQARQFHEAIGLTGVIVTKLDGSGKGGIIVAIQNELGIPPRFIGTGEKLDDFAPFDRDDFVNRIL
ncbi:MAG: signal recognition particle-docking protein FtsY [Chthoniobacterales bacterium]